MGLLTRAKPSPGPHPVIPFRRRSRVAAWPLRRPPAAPPDLPPSSAASWRQRAGRVTSFLIHPPLWLTLLACAAILFARRPELVAHPQFWAEDGALFFAQGWVHGARVLIEPYAGYLHLTQRLVTALAVQFDPRWAPAIFVGASLALTLYVAARTQSSRLPFRPHVAFAFAVVLVPDAFEVLLFLVNIQWVLAGGLLLLLVSRDAHRPRHYVHDTVAALLLGLTGPFSVLFAPLFVWRALHRRTTASTLLAALVLACGAVQAWFILKAPLPPPDTRVATETLLAIPGMRVLASLFVGHFVPLDYPLLVETALGAIAIALVAALAARPGPARLERTWLALAFVVLLAASVLRCRNVLPGLCHFSFGSRYFFAPQLIFLWLLATLATDSRRWLARTATVALLWMVAVNLPRLHENALVDQHWAVHAAKLRAGEAVTIPINPTDWSFTVPARPQAPAVATSAGR